MRLLPGRSSLTHGMLAALFFTSLAAAYTWPLLPRLHDAVVSDPYDPMLNASILWWNATVVPLTGPWWNPPFFFPATGVTAFTEHLLGITVLTAPVFWLTRDPVATYNLAVFISWPLSAMAAWWLVRRLTGRDDAALVAGLAYGFTPYRLAEISHLQSLSSYWLPIVLVALHGYLDDRRARWLLLFGVAWLLQSLANGYYLLMGAVLVGLWLAYFGTSRTGRAALPALLATWGAASLPLLPILLGYRRIHEFYGLRRELYEVLAFSAQPHSFVEVSGAIRWWSRVLPASEHDLFPGATALTLLAIAGLGVAWRWHVESRSRARPHRIGARLAAAGTVLSGAALSIMLVRGPWRIERGTAVLFKMDNPDRALIVFAVSIVALFVLSPRLRSALAQRSALLFYGTTMVVMALLACGPVLHVGDATILAAAPYKWLMALPGFDQIRVPRRFWMLGVLCLSAAAGLAFDRLSIRPFSRRLLLAAAATGLLCDGWLVAMPLAAPPALWPDVEHQEQGVAILQLPLGPDWDGAATYRSMAHRRPTVNGVSGYDPPHYAPLQSGLNAHDPAVLDALASFGPYDIVIDRADDGDGAWQRYALTAAGASLRAGTDAHVVVRVPRGRALEAASPGVQLPIVSVTTSAHDGAAAIDNLVSTLWEDGPQHDGQWVVADLGETRTVASVSTSLGAFARDFPRQLLVDVSTDAVAWSDVWAGPGAAPAFLAAVRGPRDADMRIAFAPTNARYIRLRQTATHPNLWRIAELRVYAPRP